MAKYSVPQPTNADGSKFDPATVTDEDQRPVLWRALMSVAGASLLEKDYGFDVLESDGVDIAAGESAVTVDYGAAYLDKAGNVSAPVLSQFVIAALPPAPPPPDTTAPDAPAAVPAVKVVADVVQTPVAVDPAPAAPAAPVAPAADAAAAPAAPTA